MAGTHLSCRHQNASIAGAARPDLQLQLPAVERSDPAISGRSPGTPNFGRDKATDASSAAMSSDRSQARPAGTYQ
jgi:hypothetical protein